jgi:hypothetical protein
VFQQARSKIYEEGSRERRTQKTREALTQIAEVTERIVKPVAPEIARTIDRRIEGESIEFTKLLQRRYSAPELLELVVAIAKDVLPPRYLSDFLKRLSERLLGK